MRENGFKLVKQRSWKYIAQTITDADNADDGAFIPNTTAKVQSLLHSLEREVEGIGFYVRANKTEYICFNKRGDISTLMGGPLKLVDKFTYRGSSVSSYKNFINKWLAKALKAIDRLSAIWKLDVSDEIKYNFCLAAVVSIWMHHMDAN